MLSTTQYHRRLTARQSRAMSRLSWAELRSMRRNSARSILDLLLQCRPSMSVSARALWRLSHKSHRGPSEPSELPGIAREWLLQQREGEKNCQVQSNMSNIHRVHKHPKMKNLACVCWQEYVHINTYERCLVYVVVCTYNLLALLRLLLHAEFKVKCSTLIIH